MNLTEFLHMGGYAFHVWTSYGIALLILVINVVTPVLHHRKIRADIARKLRRERRDA